MSRKQQHPLRARTDEARLWLQKIVRSKRAPASHVPRAKQLLVVAAGPSDTGAAPSSGRQSGDAVAQLGARFNRAGLQAVEPQKGGGPKPKYGARERARIVAQVRRSPDPAQDGTATWALLLLRRALRQAPDGLPAVRSSTIRTVIQEAGFRWPRTRSWCETGVAIRKRKSGEVVQVVDPDGGPKKTCLSGLTGQARSRVSRCGPKMKQGRSKQNRWWAIVGQRMGRGESYRMSIGVMERPSCCRCFIRRAESCARVARRVAQMWCCMAG